jgi:uncharacterized protein (DUF885 family)
VSRPPATIEAEDDRYIGLPAQTVSCQLGVRVIQDLRRRANARLGTRCVLRDLHDRRMTAGRFTQPVVANRVCARIDARVAEVSSRA